MSYFQKRLNRKLSAAISGQRQTETPKLLAKGADANLAEGHFGGSPLYLAARDPENKTSNWGNGDTTTIVKALLAKGADPNAPEKDNDTPLLQLLRHGNRAGALAVIGKGAHVNARSNEGYTPLYLAVQMGAEDLCRELIVRGANVNDRGPHERSALTAAAYGREDIVTLLLDAGADIAARDAYGYTALLAAAASNHQALIAPLAESGADLQAVDSAGNTALHLVAKKGWGKMARALIDAGANPKAADANMNSPADLAEKEFPRLAAMIRNPAAIAGDGETPAPPPVAWTLTAPDEIARISVKTAVGYRMTEVFNFSARTYTQIASNLQSNAESQAIKAFSELDDPNFVEAAHQELLKQGGTARHEGAIMKKLPAPGAGA